MTKSDPYALRPGYAYHSAEVERLDKPSHLADTEAAMPWFAECKACGWRGPARYDKAAAEDDAVAHDTTHNEEVPCRH